VELWVSCSGVASAIEDGEAREALEHAGCRAVQFSVEITARLHDKNMFIDNTRGLGLNVPETRGMRSVEEAVEFLHGKERERGRRYVLKFTGTDDKIRADMTLLPLTTREETRRHVAMFKPSLERPFVLQQFISGPEFCTHSIAIRGKIKAFTACESSELLMHYRAMNPGSPLFKAFLQYTEIYAEKMGEEFTGHFSIDFLADEDIGNGKGRSVDELMNKIFPIKCNPRAHTAAVLFTGKSEEVAEAYLSLLDEGQVQNKMKPIVFARFWHTRILLDWSRSCHESIASDIGLSSGKDRHGNSAWRLGRIPEPSPLLERWHIRNLGSVANVVVICCLLAWHVLDQYIGEKLVEPM